MGPEGGGPGLPGGGDTGKPVAWGGVHPTWGRGGLGWAWGGNPRQGRQGWEDAQRMQLWETDMMAT